MCWPKNKSKGKRPPKRSAAWLDDDVSDDEAYIVDDLKEQVKEKDAFIFSQNIVMVERDAAIATKDLIIAEQNRLHKLQQKEMEKLKDQKAEANYKLREAELQLEGANGLLEDAESKHGLQVERHSVETGETIHDQCVPLCFPRSF